MSRLFRRAVATFDFKNEPEIYLSEAKDGSGTIVFGHIGPSWGLPNWLRPLRSREKIPASFELIEDARKVYELVRRVQTGNA